MRFSFATVILLFVLFFTAARFPQQQATLTNMVLKNTPSGTWHKLKLPVKGKLNTWNYACRNYFMMPGPNGSLYILWQTTDDLTYHLTTLSADLTSATDKTLPLPAKTHLMAATGDEAGHFFILYFEHGAGAVNDVATLCKTDAAGKVLSKNKLSSAQTDLDIWRIESYGATLVHSNGILGLFMGRLMNTSSDGLNHQGGIAVTFDAKTLAVIKNTGQTSGHSFDNYLMKNSKGEFIGIDLGDNYPRGINMHYMTRDSRRSRLVYTFKTYHGTSANGYGRVFPAYPEISKGSQKFFKWSNDNNTYTELGGITEVGDGYLVVFAGEPDSTGKALNNARFGVKADCHNIGLVKVSPEFYNYTIDKPVISKGITESGGFYTFGGSWTAQKNEGVVWLTNNRFDNAANVKTQLLPNGQTLIVWQNEPFNYEESRSRFGYQALMMTVDKNGKIVVPVTPLGNEISLTRRDDPLLLGNRLFIIAPGTNSLELAYLELK